VEAQTLAKTLPIDFDEFVRQVFHKQWATAQPPISTWEELQRQIKAQACRKGRSSHLLRGARQIPGDHNP